MNYPLAGEKSHKENLWLCTRKFGEDRLEPVLIFLPFFNISFEFIKSSAFTIFEESFPQQFWSVSLLSFLIKESGLLMIF